MRFLTFWGAFLVVFVQGAVYGMDDDLAFMYNTIKVHHPGMYNVQDPGFPFLLEETYAKAKEAYAKAKEAYAKAQDDEAKQEVLWDFCQPFQDIHLRVVFHNWMMPPTKAKPWFFLNHPTKDTAWVGLSTFLLAGTVQEEWDAFLKEIAGLREKKAIVFDLRGNNGGNSFYGWQIIETLFGKDYAQQKQREQLASMFMDWRATKDNLEHYKQYIREGRPTYVDDVCAGMEKALNKGENYYREYRYMPLTADDIPIFSACSARIVVVTDWYVASAALTFIDGVKLVAPQCVLVGEETRGDRLYMDVRSEPLPSGKGNFVWPIMLFHNRPRGDNVTYVPDVPCDTKKPGVVRKSVRSALEKMSEEKNGM